MTSSIRSSVSLPEKSIFPICFLTLDGSHYETLAAAEKAGAAVFKYGSFISNVINFIIMALVVFCIVKFLNKLTQTGTGKTGSSDHKKMSVLYV